MKKKTKKIAWAIIAFVFTVLLGIYGILRYQALSPTITFENTDNDILAEIPIISKHGICTAIFSPGNNSHWIEIIIDTGNNIECVGLAPDAWEQFEKNGLIEKESKWLPPFPQGTAHNLLSGKMRFNETYQKGSLLILPLHITSKSFQNGKLTNYEVKNFDNLFGIKWPKNKINNVHFTKSLDRSNIIGMSFLYDQIVEFSKRDEVMRFRKFAPLEYKRSIDLKVNWQNMPFRSYAIPAEVNGRTELFFIDTGFSNMPIRLPQKDAKYSKHQLTDSIIPHTYSGNDSLVNNRYYKDEACDVIIGGKKYTKPVYYVDNFVTNYVINPFIFFDEDFIIDFKNWKMWFKDDN